MIRDIQWGDIIGEPYRRTNNQWVKIIGRDNIVNPQARCLIIKNDWIKLCYFDSVEKGYTTNDFGNILFALYIWWAKSPKGNKYFGLCAEEIHDNLMVCFAKYWSYKITPSTRYYYRSILNMINMVAKFKSMAYTGIRKRDGMTSKLKAESRKATESLEVWTQYNDVCDIDDLYVIPEKHKWFFQ